MPYSENFFSSHQAGSASSAARVAPLILELTGARSVIDVGCGIGTWLAEFVKLGVTDVQGVDGPWVKPEQLLIPRERFAAADLARELPVSRAFDVAISMEVAEHLPESGAERFVESLTKLSPVVVFSAAIPMQEGTDHINEQWPGYWSAKFGARGFAPIDCVRPAVWNDGAVAWWYAQNTMVYASAPALERSAALRAAKAVHGGEPLALVHPGCLNARVTQPIGLRRILRELPSAIGNALRAKAGGAPPA
jgi:SAM-dependent methyltransferase